MADGRPTHRSVRPSSRIPSRVATAWDRMLSRSVMASTCPMPARPPPRGPLRRPRWPGPGPDGLGADASHLVRPVAVGIGQRQQRDGPDRRLRPGRDQRDDRPEPAGAGRGHVPWRANGSGARGLRPGGHGAPRSRRSSHRIKSSREYRSKNAGRSCSSQRRSSSRPVRASSTLRTIAQDRPKAASALRNRRRDSNDRRRRPRAGRSRSGRSRGRPGRPARPGSSRPAGRRTRSPGRRPCRRSASRSGRRSR